MDKNVQQRARELAQQITVVQKLNREILEELYGQIKN